MNELAVHFSRDDLTASCGWRTVRQSVLFGSVLRRDFVTDSGIGIPLAFDRGGILGKAVYRELMTARLEGGTAQRLGGGPCNGDGGDLHCLSGPGSN